MNKTISGFHGDGACIVSVFLTIENFGSVESCTYVQLLILGRLDKWYQLTPLHGVDTVSITVPAVK